MAIVLRFQITAVVKFELGQRSLQVETKRGRKIAVGRGEFWRVMPGDRVTLIKTGPYSYQLTGVL